MRFCTSASGSAPQAATTRRGRSARGFTLLELMVVVAIIGILAAMAGPGFGTMVRLGRVGEVARELRAGLAAAQSNAVATGVEHCLLVDRKNNRWELRNDSDDDPTNGCESDPISTYVVPYETVGFGPDTGFPEAFVVPYTDVPRDTWCTTYLVDLDPDVDSDEDVCAFQFTTNGTMRSEIDMGSIVVHDTKPEGDMARVEGIVFIAPTGLIRLVRGDKAE